MFNISLPFGKKHDSYPKTSATERVQNLSRQGHSDTEIIRTLRREGYSPEEADTSMKHAVRSAAIPAPPRPPAYQPEPSRQMPREPQAPRAREPPRMEPPERDFPPEQSAFEPPAPRELFPDEEYGPAALPSLPRPSALPEADEEMPRVGRRTEAERVGEVEEVAEGLMEEKWGMFEKEIDETNTKLEAIGKRVSSLETAIAEFKGVKKGDVESIKHSIDSYKESMGDVSERIEGMERAVKDSLTPMLQTMRSLSETMKSMKSGK